MYLVCVRILTTTRLIIALDPETAVLAVTIEVKVHNIALSCLTQHFSLE